MRRKTRHIKQMQKLLDTEFTFSINGTPVIGPMTLENMAYIAKFGGIELEDWLETTGPHFTLTVRYPHV